MLNIAALVSTTPPPHRQTVMHYCAALNFVEFIHELADLGAPIDSLDERGTTQFKTTLEKKGGLSEALCEN